MAAQGATLITVGLILMEAGRLGGIPGTIAAGDFLRTRYPDVRVVATEALQCPTLLQFGFGEHRIEGIGDKHIPWIHNVRNTDFVAAIDDEQMMQLMRMFNEEAGHECLRREGVDEELLASLPLLGLSSLCNLVAAVKTARYYDMDSRDVIFVMESFFLSRTGLLGVPGTGFHGVVRPALTEYRDT